MKRRLTRILFARAFAELSIRRVAAARNVASRFNHIRRADFQISSAARQALGSQRYYGHMTASSDSDPNCGPRLASARSAKPLSRSFRVLGRSFK